MRGRVKSRKLQTSRCLCRDKKILGSPPSPPSLCYLSFRHFRGAGAEKAVLFAWTENGRRRSVVAGIARVPSRRFSPVRENENASRFAAKPDVLLIPSRGDPPHPPKQTRSAVAQRERIKVKGAEYANIGMLNYRIIDSLQKYNNGLLNNF